MAIREVPSPIEGGDAPNPHIIRPVRVQGRRRHSVASTEGIVRERLHTQEPSPRHYPITRSSIPPQDESPEVQDARLQLSRLAITEVRLPELATLTPEKIRAMEPQVRMQRKKIVQSLVDLNRTRDDLSTPTRSTGSSRSSGRSGTSSVLPSPRDAQHVLSMIDEVQEEIRLTEVVRSICATRGLTDGVWEFLALAGVTVIGTVKLFSAIRDYLQSDEVSTLLPLLGFCRYWYEFNQETKVIDAQVMSIFDDIVRMTEQHPQQQIQASGQKLKELQGIKPKLKLGLVQIQVRNYRYEFPKLVERLEGKEYTQIVQEVAQDILGIQVALYRQISPHCFIPEKSTQLDQKKKEQYSHFLSQLRSFFIDSILNESVPAKRARLVAFFIDVVKVCVAARDYATGFIFTAVCTDPNLNRLQLSWEGTESLQELFSIAGHSKTLRDRIKSDAAEKEKYVPYLGICEGNVVKMLESPALVEEEDKDPVYNIDKCKIVTQEIHRFCESQRRWEFDEDLLSRPFYSNIVDLIFTHDPLSDDKREEKSRLE